MIARSDVQGHGFPEERLRDAVMTDGVLGPSTIVRWRRDQDAQQLHAGEWDIMRK
jgi:hypothetical protein